MFCPMAGRPTNGGPGLDFYATLMDVCVDATNEGGRVEMDVTRLQKGDQVRTIDRNTAEVVKPSQDGRWILVKYLECPGDADLVGTEDLCSGDELAEQLPSARTGS